MIRQVQWRIESVKVWKVGWQVRDEVEQKLIISHAIGSPVLEGAGQASLEESRLSRV